MRRRRRRSWWVRSGLLSLVFRVGVVHIPVRYEQWSMGGKYKYSVDKKSSTLTPTERWRGLHDNPHISKHALDRWDERTPPESRSIEYAYLRSKECEVAHKHSEFCLSSGRRPDEVRVYGGVTDEGNQYFPLFIICNNNIVTVYDTQYVKDEPLRKYLFAHVQGNNLQYE